MKRLPLAAGPPAAVLALLISGTQAFALNWEGHDDWFLGSVMIEEFTRGLPPPLARPMPTCSERRAMAAVNRYEQVPVPGVNCRKDHKSGGSDAR